LSSATQPDAIIAADVIVISQIVTREHVAYLRIEAFQSGTATCVGVLELPINSASPTEFDPPLPEQVAAWWPGVVAGRTRAGNCAVWTFAPLGMSDGSQKMTKARETLDRILSESTDVFYARYSYVPAAQQEVLLRIMGLSRSSTGQFSVAADYIVALGLVRDNMQVTIRGGKDNRPIATCDVEHEDTAAWLARQMLALKLPPVSAAPDAAAAKKQATEELRHADEVMAQLKKFMKGAYVRQQAAKRDNYLPEDQARIDELSNEYGLRVERAAQLDPTCDEAAFRTRPDFGDFRDFLKLQKSAEASLQFLDRFPKSKHYPQVLEDGIFALSGMFSYLRPGMRNEAGVRVPANLDYDKLRRQYGRQLLGLQAQCASLYLRGEKTGDHWADYPRLYRQVFEGVGIGPQRSTGYFDIASGDEVEEALAAYARVCDAHPEKAVPSDFLRLRYFARKEDKQSYIKLVTRMQHQWPNTTDIRWKFYGRQAVEEMGGLLGVKPADRSLEQWLKAKAGPSSKPAAESGSVRP
jgi:hypothetical protein